MKYLVMECHEGYAVLMDEESAFVRAANINYSVGQTVCDPMILEEQPSHTVITRSVFVKVAAAAACMVLLSAAGVKFYSRNLKTQSVMMIGSDLKIEMELNSKGKVIRVNSDTADGQEVLGSYSGKSKDIVEAVNDIVDVMKDKGYITNDDTLDLYIDAENSQTYNTYKEELEQEISVPKLNVQNIGKLDRKDPEKEKPSVPVKPEGTAEPEPPKPPHENGVKPTHPEPSHEAPKPELPSAGEETPPPPPPVHEGEEENKLPHVKLDKDGKKPEIKPSAPPVKQETPQIHPHKSNDGALLPAAP